MQSLCLSDVEQMVKVMADVAVANEKYFSELDAVVGDADFGVSLAAGFRNILEQWEKLDRSSISSFLINAGSIITKHVGGCSGPIWGTCFMRAGLKSKGKESITLSDLVVMLRGAMEGMMARGGAQLGDKTLLDAMAPASEEFEKWGRKDPQDCVAAFEAAADAAAQSVEKARDWVAMRGRQSFTGERSKGTVDPGMVAVSTMLRAVTDSLKAR
jgi:phosphoenolpyruvate---glycerone phosphotransferase subunit DhaL